MPSSPVSSSAASFPEHPKNPASWVQQSEAAVSAAVEQLYNTYPFPPDPLLDEPPPGYNWRWYWPAAYSFCSGRLSEHNAVRILDAGCGTGVGTDYLAHLNPEATVVAIDLSPGAIAVATDRLRRSGGHNVSFQALSIYDVAQIPGEFDLINCVGVLHHMPDPIRGIQALATQLKPGGLLHIFVYGELGRWEIQLMQEAIALLQADQRGNYTDGVQIGRELFAKLSDTNRLVQYEKTYWAAENTRDECFADMYVHPQETDYNIKTLFELIDASGLEFVGFSNPEAWSLERLLGQAPELMARAASLGERDRYRLIELLNPHVPHYEFFLARPPLDRSTWENDTEIKAATIQRNPCMHGWPSRSLLNQDYHPATISEAGFEFLKAAETAATGTTVGQIIETVPTPLEEIRQLWQQRMIFLGLSADRTGPG
ncbi:MAG: class I SAM-dependent methyltransferase [Synechococcales cyanobacterium RU_4_20]|nr:class I SAM-dependent methyltransferase [Synechococcales cyanobacterium RU_4_20]